MARPPSSVNQCVQMCEVNMSVLAVHRYMLPPSRPHVQASRWVSGSTRCGALLDRGAASTALGGAWLKKSCRRLLKLTKARCGR